MSRAVVLPGLSAADHQPHALHAGDRIWREKNCYVDLWIELLHARGLDPRACLAFVFGLDFEGDQWTFFKPPLADLRTLYGIDVQELTVWRPLLDHASEHLAAGKWLAVEVDSFWLPDTAATDYQSAHSKTTIVLNEVDAVERRLGYFHNAGYFTLNGYDFDGLFAPSVLPPYVESIRTDRLVRLDSVALRAHSRRLFDEHFHWRPRSNPVLRFGDRFEADAPELQRAGLAYFHRWAFAGVRQLGAAAELAAIYLDWLWPGAPPAEAILAFERIAQQSKTLLLKAARSANTGRAIDVGTLIGDMAHDWDTAIARLAPHAAGG